MVSQFKVTPKQPLSPFFCRQVAHVDPPGHLSQCSLTGTSGAWPYFRLPADGSAFHLFLSNACKDVGSKTQLYCHRGKVVVKFLPLHGGWATYRVTRNAGHVACLPHLLSKRNTNAKAHLHSDSFKKVCRVISWLNSWRRSGNNPEADLSDPTGI